MFWANRERKDELEEQVYRLERQVASLTKDTSNLDVRIKEQRATIKALESDYVDAKQKALYKCAPMIDLLGMRAFAVERMYKDGEQVTVIGYVKPDNNISEWILWCSPEQHKAIANELRMLVKIPE